MAAYLTRFVKSFLILEFEFGSWIVPIGEYFRPATKHHKYENRRTHTGRNGSLKLQYSVKILAKPK